jgi:uncharacterized Zn finger protein
MSNRLGHLTEADIRARCTGASFERGQGYYGSGAVRQRMRLDDGLETRVADTHTYRVTVVRQTLLAQPPSTSDR